MSETLFPLLTGSLAASAFFAGWFTCRRRYLGLMRKLCADHERRDGLMLGRLAAARRQVASMVNENSMLKSEIARQRARLLRAHPLKEPLVEPTSFRTPVERTPDWRQPDGATGFQDTQPWAPGSS